LVALWREALLAQKVLAGKTRGYTKHPQLERFKAHSKPLAAIGAYLAEVKKEAVHRGYRFSDNKIIEIPTRKVKMPVATGQLAFELRHLKKKLANRDSELLKKVARVKKAHAHPVFAVKKGKMECWEKTGKKRA